MPVAHETIVFTRILAKPAEALTLLDRIDKIRPRGPGHRILLIAMKGLAGNALLPTPSVLEQTLKESPDLELGQRREGLRILAACVGRSTPSADDAELSVRALLQKERHRILRGAISKAEAALSEESIDDAEAAIMDTAASLAELDLESQSSSAERDKYRFFTNEQDLGPPNGFNMPKLDALLDGGGRRTDLISVAAYSKGGKTTLCTNVTYWAVRNGRNVVDFSLEIPKKKKVALYLTMHSHHFKEGGFRFKDFMNHGKFLREADRDLMKRIEEDWRENPDYGFLEIVQPKDDATIMTVQHHLMQIRRKVPTLDVCLLDYLQYLEPLDTRAQPNRQVGDTFKMARNLSMRFNAGEGLFIISPHPMKQEAHDAACKKGFYTQTSLGESREVSAKSTVVVWILLEDELRELNKGKVGVLFNRDGPRGPVVGWPIQADMETRLLTDLAEGPSQTTLDEIRHGGADDGDK